MRSISLNKMGDERKNAQEHNEREREKQKPGVKRGTKDASFMHIGNKQWMQR